MIKYKVYYIYIDEPVYDPCNTIDDIEIEKRNVINTTLYD